MTDFAGTLEFLRIALWVAMETMHYHIVHISYFEDNVFKFRESH